MWRYSFFNHFIACRTIATLKPQEAIQCRNCGHRILYKIRTNARILFLCDYLN